MIRSSKRSKQTVGDDPSRRHSGASEIIEWLAGDECHDIDDAGLTAGLGRRLRAAGLPMAAIGQSFRPCEWR